MNITYVTALYNIYDTDVSTTRLKTDVASLLASGINLVIYADDYFNNILKDMNLTSNIKVVLLSLDNFEMYNMIINKKDKVRLPSNRNNIKDTYEYIGLMNTKIEFIRKSIELIDTEYIGWLDAGIRKHFSNPKKSFDYLKNLKIINVETTLIPGCYFRQVNSKDLINNVYWIFSGSFLILKKSYVEEFYKLSKEIVGEFINCGHVFWEVNIWVFIYNKYPNSIKWYYGNHDDTIINIPMEYCSF